MRLRSLYSKLTVGCATAALLLTFGFNSGSADPPSAPHGGTVTGANQDQGNTGNGDGDDNGDDGIQAMAGYAGTQQAMSATPAMAAINDDVPNEDTSPIIIPGVTGGGDDDDDDSTGLGVPGETLEINAAAGIDGEWDALLSDEELSGGGSGSVNEPTNDPSPTWDLGPQTPVSFLLMEDKPRYRYAPDLLQFVEEESSPEQTHLGIQSGLKGRVYFAPLGEF